MSTMYPSLPKLAVRDSFDDDDLTDIDDEVFIRDGKNCSLKLDDDGGVKRPLMAPRRKYRKTCGFETHKFPYRALFAPFCYGVMALVVLLSLIVLCIFTVNIFPMPLTVLRNWLSHEPKEVSIDSDIVPCTSLTTKVLWTRSLPKLASESPLRSTDANGDGVEDIILGFSTGLDTTDSPEYACASYIEGQIPCLGGILALNGKTGETLWTHWTRSIVSTIDCSLDLTNDKTKDCIISGPGILHAINGYDGSSVWETPISDIPTFERQEPLDIYNGKFITDVDGDGIGDVIASHTIHMQLDEAHSSKILLISGAKGNVLHSLSLPNREQIFLAPQKLVHPDGESMFVVVTSSQKETGGLYIVPEVNLVHGNLKLRELHHDTGKGVAVPPILVDITLDGVEDIVVAIYNSTIITYDGLTFEPIWNYTIPNSKLLFIPVPGYYNDDDIPDFMVKYQIDTGLSYHTTATVIDGKTGEPLLEKSTDGSLSKEMSGVSITVDGFGNDWFLHWSIDCLNYEKGNLKYQMLEKENLSPELHADLCKVRFNSTLTTNLFALSQHVGPPGMSLYSSEDWTTLEFFKNENSGINSVNAKKYVHNEEDYEERKKFASTDFQNAKWPLENGQANKDYDLSYDFDGNVDAGGQRSIDYSQVDEIRQQRSNGDDTVIDPITEQSQDAVREKYNNTTSIDVKVNRLDDTSKMNMLEQGDVDLNVLADELAIIDKGTSTQKRKRAINFSGAGSTDARNSTEKDTIMLMNTTLIPKRKNMANTTFAIEETYNGALKSIEDEHNSYNESEEHQKTKRVTQIYAHNFPNIIQNTEEDESIEKIFKRESLKNKNNERTVKEQVTALPVNLKQDKVKLRKPRKKRETQSGNYNIYGIQQQPLTGILLPSILESKGKTSVDFIFSTFWLPPPKESAPLSQGYLDCIRRNKGFLKKKFQFRKNDIIKECLAEQRFNNNVLHEAEDRENFKIDFGQMTVYRMKIECVCPEDMLPNQSCKNISARQSWPEHLGSLGNGYFKSIQRSSV